MATNGMTQRAMMAFLLIVFGRLVSITAYAQGTAFTYQGKLTDSGNPASGQYDFRFRLFDTQLLGTGTQQGATLTVANVTVTVGIFTVQLDFGACAACFNGAPRFLEVAAKPTSSGTFTTLEPRQPVTATPYAIKAAAADGLSVACVNCVTSSQIQSVQGAQVTGNIAGSQISGTIPVASVPAGSTNYIQNTASQQTMSNFNISGDGTAGGTLSGNIVNAATQFNLSNSHILSNAGFGNLFAGVGAGTHNTGNSNSFFGNQAGFSNIAGNTNSFFGSSAGFRNTSGNSNTFFGSEAGFNNTSGNSNTFFGNQAGRQNAGSFNSFFGSSAGFNNTSGNSNAFFGDAAGFDNTTSCCNSFFGQFAGSNNTTGAHNAFFGFTAGINNATGSFNTFIGERADFTVSGATGDKNTLLGSLTRVNSGVSNATAVGAFGSVTQSDSLVLGSILNVNGCTAVNNCDSVKVGIGTTAPAERLHVAGNEVIEGNVGIGTIAPINLLTIGQPEATLATGRVGIFSPSGLNLVLRETTNDVEGFVGVNSSSGVIFGSMTNDAVFFRTNMTNRMTITADGKVGIGTTNPDQMLTVNGGASKPGGGSWAVFSDQRLKSIKGRFTAGLNEVMRLQPIRYEYKPENALGIQASGEQIGFAAQAVERVLPEAVIRNSRGYLLVNNDPILWAMLNAIKELKAENDSLKQRLDEMSREREGTKQQQTQIETLNKTNCLNHRKTEGCK